MSTKLRKQKDKDKGKDKGGDVTSSKRARTAATSSSSSLSSSSLPLSSVPDEEDDSDWEEGGGEESGRNWATRKLGSETEVSDDEDRNKRRKEVTMEAAIAQERAHHETILAAKTQATLAMKAQYEAVSKLIQTQDQSQYVPMLRRQKESLSQIMKLVMESRATLKENFTQLEMMCTEKKNSVRAVEEDAKKIKADGDGTYATIAKDIKEKKARIKELEEKKRAYLAAEQAMRGKIEKKEDKLQGFRMGTATTLAKRKTGELVCSTISKDPDRVIQYTLQAEGGGGGEEEGEGGEGTSIVKYDAVYHSAEPGFEWSRSLTQPRAMKVEEVPEAVASIVSDIFVPCLLTRSK